MGHENVSLKAGSSLCTFKTAYLLFWDEPAWSMSYWPRNSDSKFLKKKITPSQASSTEQHKLGLKEQEGKQPIQNRQACYRHFSLGYIYKPAICIPQLTPYNMTLTKNNKTRSTKTRVLHKALGRESRTESSAHSSQPCGLSVIQNKPSVFVHLKLNKSISPCIPCQETKAKQPSYRHLKQEETQLSLD